MSDMISTLVEWVMTLISSAGYWGVFLSMIIESFFVPFPSEVIMPFSGFLAAEGRFDIWMLALVGGIGSYVGTLPFYFLGYIGGDTVVRKFLQKWGKWIMTTEAELDKSNEIFKKRGKLIVLVGRLIPGIRSVLSIPAGIAKMPFVSYTLYTLVGSTFWSFILGLCGYLLGENWEVVGGYLEQFKSVIIVIIILIGVYYFWSKFYGQKRQEEKNK